MVIPYYILINVVAFAMYGADKYFAKKDIVYNLLTISFRLW